MTSKTGGARVRVACAALALGVLVAGAGVAITSGARSSATPRPYAPASEAVVATVAGQQITVRELMQFAAKTRAGVIQTYQSRYGVTVGADFWTTRLGSSTPRDALVRAALSGAASFAVIVREAVADHLMSAFSYESFVTTWRDENARRRSEIAAGHTIYGPQQYSESDYFDLFQADLSAAVQKHLTSDGTLSASQAEIAAYYRAHLADFTARPPGSAAAVGPAVPATLDSVEPQIVQRIVAKKFAHWLTTRVANSATYVRSDSAARLPIS